MKIIGIVQGRSSEIEWWLKRYRIFAVLSLVTRQVFLDHFGSVLQSKFDAFKYSLETTAILLVL